MVGFVLKVPGLQCKELSPGHWNFSIPHRDKGLASALREVETQAREIRRLEVLVVELRESVSKLEELHPSHLSNGQWIDRTGNSKGR